MRRTLLACLALVLALTGCAGGTTAATETPTTAAHSETGTSGLPTVPLSSLPPEAQQAYEVIEQGGPYKYRQDDAVFGNREGNLPDEDYGWYREYTVVTPGSSDRGARRFVVGEDGTYYYTDDHYQSFSEVIP